MTDRERLRAEIAATLIAPGWQDLVDEASQIRAALKTADTIVTLSALGQPEQGERESDVSNALLWDIEQALLDIPNSDPLGPPGGRHHVTLRYVREIQRARSAAEAGRRKGE